MIVVCPLSQFSAQIAKHRPSHIVTLGSSDAPPLPEGCEAHHLVLTFHDIAAPHDGLTVPDKSHVVSFIDFVREWSREAPLLIHCYAGVSRSPAAAYIAALVLNPQADEMQWALRLRALSPSATPNSRLIALADQLLERRGRMIGAINAIGRGADAFEGEVFSFPVED